MSPRPCSRLSQTVGMVDVDGMHIDFRTYFG